MKECQSSPCKNGGTCVIRPADYICKCPNGFRGKDCQEASGDPRSKESGEPYGGKEEAERAFIQGIEIKMVNYFGKTSQFSVLILGSYKLAVYHVDLRSSPIDPLIPSSHGLLVSQAFPFSL